jgi:16S rRNA (cytosine1402-N4)-methyltransferase
VTTRPDDSPNESSSAGSPGDSGTGERGEYASEYHAPVLSHDVRERLITDPSGRYVDATLGGGGHAEALLDALAPGAFVLGIDRDADALDAARRRLADEIEAERFRAVRGNFAQLAQILAEETLGGEPFAPVDGLLLDLGVSSHQIDTAERGFSFQQDGPLDMRMDARRGVTAEQIVNGWGERDLAEIFWNYGDENRGRAIARAVVDRRPLSTTGDLADAVRSVVPPHEETKTLARVFQALRIAVNDELDALESALEQSVDVLRTGGRIAVISYHSLEDRRAKRFLRYGNFEGEPRRDIYGTLITPWEEMTRKPVAAGPRETEANPRARSARLRVAERRDSDAGPAAP